MDKKRIIIICIIILSFILCILLSFIYYSGKFSIKFETGTQDEILMQYVKKNEKIKKPITPIKEGYIFKEWQLDGETFDFNTSIKGNIVLTAKWIKEEYINVSFITNSDYKIENRKVLKGDIIDNLPDSKKDDYTFIGWYLDDTLYNNTQIYSDSILIAQYKNDKINMTYKVGDNVVIVGNYSNSSMANDAYNKKAIGWNRTILAILEDKNYPYVIGDSNGITGYFKAESINIK